MNPSYPGGYPYQPVQHVQPSIPYYPKPQPVVAQTIPVYPQPYIPQGYNQFNTINLQVVHPHQLIQGIMKRELRPVIWERLGMVDIIVVSAVIFHYVRAAITGLEILHM